MLKTTKATYLPSLVRNPVCKNRLEWQKFTDDDRRQMIYKCTI